MAKEPENKLLQSEEAEKLEEKSKEIIRKLDKESATRSFKNPLMKKIFFIACLLVSGYHLYTAAFGPPVTLVHRSLHVAMIMALGFLMYPAGKSSDMTKPSVLDWILSLLSFAAPIYIWSDYMGVVQRAGNPNNTDLAMATLLVVLVLECSRRVTGNALTILSVVFIIYGLFGREFPGMFMHRGYDWASLSNHFFANTEGIYGTSVSVAASYIFLFILFGTVMSKCGMGQFFNDIALALAGHTKGGPAKVSVIASGFLGSINGSAVANVVTTGAFTIPLMKKTGYSKEFSGAVEAAASVGGQLLPPIMGAAAFIMAEMISVPYSTIITWAAIPALLYYLSIVLQVHLRASKDGLIGLPKEQLPKTSDVMKCRSHLLLPVLFLLYMLFFSGTTVIFSAVMTILVTIVVSMFRKETRMSLSGFLDALANGAKQTVSVAVACACVGIIIGVCSKTGFGLTMANTIIALGSTSLLFTLFFTMITCMILGMGLPSIPAYIITATIAAPALAKLGIPAGAAHMFSFYYAMFANLTPPVALASFAAAGLSGGNPMKTGVASVKLAIAGFIVPFMFVYAPQLMLINTTLAEGAWVAASACVGVFLIAVSVEGYLFTRMAAWLRVVAAAGALLLIKPGFETDAIGLAVLLVVLFWQKKKAAKAVAA
ncbi:TRAP transporter permease [Schwartzia succinivorans]|jgi:TRAP transporter 4TM/12TM fusion protein|uniref:TRAP transporter, 4TM/12TM fusion protein n=2 Tax=Selenomonadaceae TaxID=1843491 RepID=A0A1M4Z5F9_9FIRM|nr:TRAP transporter permease [Schwartzia succinivorans]MBE6097811.1 TRAP transporter permease [Schwartzia succinivorans]SHF12826.1 TRAP transporter, 4TM/12TM fusion protein [Schwartzia succinivorans DSM 10502]